MIEWILEKAVIPVVMVLALLTLLSMVGLVVQKLFDDKPVIRLSADQWECTDKKIRSDIIMQSAGNVVIPVPMTKTKCVQYNRR